jgi:hypothetical protein
MQLMLILCITIPFYSFQSGGSNEWKIITHQDGVVLSKQVVDCTNPDVPFEFLILKVENTTDKTVRVEFSYDLVKNGQLVPSDPSDVMVSITLRPGEEIQGECAWDVEQNLSIFKGENSNSVRMDDILLASFDVQSL